ncbi:beta-N-acetylhexosaminidase [Psychrilyobacter atlanticus]|uniref:beta-N-acetylhexosaminidase n=1 Tax=Psychrilyobacter atlanticus TaxID=271091 RepID=UPI00040D2A21|nr:beta-N-acetylhexosaminidase [Psychrilyobacter atlanticus]
MKKMKKMLIALGLGLGILGCTNIAESTVKADTLKVRAEKIVEGMSDREKLGQLMMIDFRNWNERPFTAMNSEVKQIIQDYEVGGIILFRENLANTEQTVKLIDDMQRSSKNMPLFIGTDQEGGYVTRLQEGTEMPGNMALGASRDLDLAYEVGKTIGTELDALGINFNFAPVVDVNSNQKNPIIGVRSFGDNPKLVGNMAASYIDGLQGEGLISTIKHFPGHGNTEADTHIGLATVNYNKRQWENIDKIPFQMAIDNGVEAIMTAHVIIPTLDDTKIRSQKDGTLIGTPATLSKPIMTGVLRDEMNFQGIIITDALNMHAISENFGEAESVERAILAGGDIMLMPVIVWRQKEVKKLDILYSTILKEMKSNRELKNRVEESAERVVELKLKKGLDKKINVEKKIKDAEKIIGSKENKGIEKIAAERGITLIKNENILPMNLAKGKKILLIAETKTRGNMMEDEILKIEKDMKIEKLTVDYRDGLTNELKNGIKNSDYILLATYNLKNDTKINEIIEFSNKNEKKMVSISTRNPYDIIYTPTVKANIAIYGITGFDQTNYGRNSLEANIRAGIRSIFKGNDGSLVVPNGKLPVNIRNEKGEIIYKIGHGLSY